MTFTLQILPSSPPPVYVFRSQHLRLPARDPRVIILRHRVVDHPGERDDVSEAHPEIVVELRNRILAFSAERPPLGELSEVMNPALPYVYGKAENKSVSEKIRSHVERSRRGQQQNWEPGKYPWPAPPRNGQITYEGDGR